MVPYESDGRKIKACQEAQQPALPLQEVLNAQEAHQMVRQVEKEGTTQLVPSLRLYQEGPLEMYFAPHNLYISPKTELLLVGICPGKKQSEKALAAVAAGQGILEAKKQARFYGQTKTNLIAMLKELGVEDLLHQPVDQLLDDLDSGLETIALIPFPVFMEGKNYSGHRPSLKHPLLQAYIAAWFVPAIHQLPQLKVLIPLGKAVEQALVSLQKQGAINPRIRILQGFPHPSGLNASRPAVFARHKESMKQVLQTLLSPKTTAADPSSPPMP